MRAEELPADLGEFRVATFAQSFHWMDGDRVAALVRGMLEPGGRLVHVGATTHRGVATDEPLPAASPTARGDHAAGRSLPRRLAPRRSRPQAGRAARAEDDVYRRAGFDGPRRVTVPRGEVFLRSEDEIVASVFSLSSAAPHLFGERRDGVRARPAGAAADGLAGRPIRRKGARDRAQHLDAVSSRNNGVRPLCCVVGQMTGARSAKWHAV